MASIPCENEPSSSDAVAAREKSSYRDILKSTTLVGGSSVANILSGMVRSKAMAAMLGPAGFGLLGLYGSVSNLAQSIAGMGVSSSGVRQIAESAGSGDVDRIARTAAVVKRTSFLLGTLGCVFLIVFSRQVSVITFGNTRETGGVCLLSIAVFLQVVSGGQSALIQGMRRITDLAKMAAWGALFGTAITIVLVFFLRERGVVPALAGVAATTLIASWWYSRKIPIAVPRMAAFELGHEAIELLKLGFAFMITGMMALGSAYVVRIIVLHRLGFAATGLYQSAWTLGGLYVGFILQAMAADFYPRLTESANHHERCNRLVNEQVRVGLLLAGPGVIGTLTFASLVVPIFYSAKFTAAVGILRWICLGAAVQVISWPLGFILVAKNDRVRFIALDLVWLIAHISLAWFCVGYFGLNGSGMAFFGSYLFYLWLIYAMVRRLTGFRWSSGNVQTGLVFAPLIAVAFCGSYWLSPVAAACVGTGAAVAGGVYSLWALARLTSLSFVPAPLRRLLAPLPFMRSDAG